MPVVSTKPPRVHPSIQPVTDPTDIVFDLIKRCNDPGDPLGVVEADEEIQQELLKRGEAYHSQILWRELCFHWCNRDEGLGSPAEVRSLMDDVDFVGVSYKALEHVLCAEAEPDNNYSVEKTRGWVRTSFVPMAEVVEGSIRLNTLSCSHFTQGVRSIEAGVPNSSLRLGNGTNYDIDVIAEKNKKFATLIRVGIKWLVLKWALQYKHPGLSLIHI